MKELLQTSWKAGITPYEYQNIVTDFAADGKTSGPNQSQEMINYSKLNAQRSKRVEKQLVLEDSTIASLQSLKEPQKWLVLTETWCGDAANSIPVINQMAEVAGDKVKLRFLFRDENEELINQFLTRGGKSIPKLIAFNDQYEVLFDWGPRPEEAQTLYWDWRNSDDRIPYSEFHIVMQKWYMQDKNHSIQSEIGSLLN